jgi:hypothetical protein
MLHRAQAGALSNKPLKHYTSRQRRCGSYAGSPLANIRNAIASL